MLKNKQKGFTLLEILVVISIIGILVALGTAAFSTTQKKSRDARRKSDIKAVQNGFEQYHAKNNAYPTTLLEAADASIFPGGLPEDPRGIDENVYTYNLSTDSFCVCALLESSVGNTTDLPDGGSAVCTYGSGDYYCLGSLQ